MATFLYFQETKEKTTPRFGAHTTQIRISSSWKSIGESHVEGSWPLMKSNDEKSVNRF
jgi:hypothetical protein